jgi:8-oxo-dGTP pyrophosphatase MutT (NUDIX family)
VTVTAEGAQEPSAEGTAVTAGVVILKHIGGSLRVAMCRDPEKGPDAWVIPKGHIHDGESTEQAALREAQEETGAADIVLLTYLGVFQRRSLEDWGEWVQKTVHLYLGYSFGPPDIRPAPSEALAGAGWLTIGEAVERMPWPEDQEFFRQHFGAWLAQG